MNTRQRDRIAQAACLLVAVLLGACGSQKAREGEPAEPGKTNQGPAIVSVTPASGVGAKQVFTAVYSHPAGAEAIRETRILLNTDLDGRSGCYVYYDQDQNAWLLVNDQGSGSTELSLGGGASVENTQCRIDASGSSIARSGNQMTVQTALTFKAAFSGPKKIFLSAEDRQQRSTGLQPFGSWTVGAAN